MSQLVEERQNIARRSDRKGSERPAQLSGATASWVRGLLADAITQHGADPTQFSLLAVGGYGRRELSLGSDLDVVLVHEPSALRVDDVASSLWYPIWDSKIALDHSVRTIAQARTLAQEDFKVVLGLIDARVVAGNTELGESLRTGILGDWRASAGDRLVELHATAMARRSRVGDLAQLLEPDIKEAYGGLRDAVLLRALAASWTVEVPRTEWPAAVSTLLDVRDALHARGLRDRLAMQEQDDIAAEMTELLGNEATADDLLRTVYLAARDIAYASDVAWYRALRATRKPPSLAPRVLRRLTRRSASPSKGPERVPLAEGVVLVEGEVALARGASPENDRGLLLRAAAAAAQASVMLAPSTVERVSQCLPIPEPWNNDVRQSWVSLLGAGRAAVPVLEALDHAGIVSGLIPEWEAVRSLPQRNPMHEFTVDRHLVETAVHAGQRARDVARPDLLLVGAFLHDIGKGYPGDHSVVGADMTRDIAERMGFDPGDVGTLELLVRHHLLLPDIATRRDLDDPATVATVVDLVPDVESLELLHALTWADAEATGPSVRSSWRRRLITDLVTESRAQMQGHARSTVQESSAVANALAERGEPSLRLEPVEDGFSIVVSAPDRFGLLALVAGVLSLHRLQVRGARIRTESDRAAQEWLVKPLFGDPPDVRAMASDFRAALAGDLDVEDRLRRRSESPASLSTGAAPKVIVEHSAATHTVIEVRAHDETALLHRITSALVAADCRVTGAKIDTLGSEVVDAFFVTDRLGAPLSDDHAHAVRTTVQAAVEAR
ncbi:MAG: [protein-PII] uridylyltransferase [Actinomycetota bacterium]